MQAVISAEQAKKITGGRTPLVPVEYETACRALAECSTLDEAKYWDNAADALAAWAKIHHKDQAGLEAKRLKLHAYRRMGELAEQLRPTLLGSRKGCETRTGSEPGSRSLLKEHGCSEHVSRSMIAFGRMEKDKFDEIVHSPTPPTPTRLLKDIWNKDREAWGKFRDAGGPVQFRSFCRANSAKDLAASLADDEINKARVVVLECLEWLDEFEQHLTK